MITLIVASDIFGRTQAFEALADTLAPHADRAIRVDPYGGEPTDFSDEATAYTRFQEQVGLDSYTQHLRQRVASADGQRMLLIGFSVGASAIWALSSALAPASADQMMGIGLYGSQIRHLTHIQPVFPMELFFPEQEPHFEVSRLMATLESKTGVTCHTVAYHHGFMNRRSVNFHEQGYHPYIDLLVDRIRCFRGQQPGISGGPAPA